MFKVKGHTCFLGQTGYAYHARNFFTSLSDYCDVGIRNFTVDDNMDNYLTQKQRDLVVEQSLFTEGDILRTFKPLWKDAIQPFEQDIDIVLEVHSHHYFYDKYNSKIKIAYIVWESTRMQQPFFDMIKAKFDYFWCPSNWQKEMMIEQGWDKDKIFVVPEGVDPDLKPIDNLEELSNDKTFRFLLAGRWDYRKSTSEMIKAFNEEFKNDENVELVCTIDNPFAEDGFTTEQRLEKEGQQSDKIKIVHFPDRKDYIKLIQNSHCHIACSRSEGWGLTISDSIACGTPTIYAHNTAPKDFASEIGIPVKSDKELPANDCVFLKGIEGNYYEPDFEDLKRQMRYVYNNFKQLKKAALDYAPKFIKKYSWENAGKIGFQALKQIWQKRNKISVVTPFYNSCEYIDSVYQSIKSQNYDNFEWVVCDDHSDDNGKTISKLKSIALLDNRVKLINQEQKLDLYWEPQKHCSGDIIVVLDPDDLLMPPALTVVNDMYCSHENVVGIHFNGNMYNESISSKTIKRACYSQYDDLEEDGGTKAATNFKWFLPKFYNEEFESGRFGWCFGFTRTFRNLDGLNFLEKRPKKHGNEDVTKLLRLEECGDILYCERPISIIRELNKDRKHRSRNIEDFISKSPTLKDKQTIRLDYSELSYVERASFAFTGLNYETKPQNVSLIGYKKTKCAERLIKNLYFQHNLQYDAIDDSTNYILIVATDNSVRECCKIISKYKNKKISIIFDTTKGSQEKFEEAIKQITPFSFFHYCETFLHIFINEPFFDTEEEFVEHVFKDYWQINANPYFVLQQISKQESPKIAIITPHLSTGGAPEYLYQLLKTFDNLNDIHLIELSQFSVKYTVQREKIIKLLSENNFHSLGYVLDDKNDQNLFNTRIEKIKEKLKDLAPDVVYLNESLETVEYKPINDDVIRYIYDNFRVVENCHNKFLSKKRHQPDAYLFCCKELIDEANQLGFSAPKYLFDLPIIKKDKPNRNKTLELLGLDPSTKHVLNVGILNKNKNQDYIIDLAKKHPETQFHFIGNSSLSGEMRHQDDDIKDLKNCTFWGERNDVDKFMSCMDVFLFPSLSEVNPISVKEALSYDMEVWVNDLPCYNKYKDKRYNINFLDTKKKSLSNIVFCILAYCNTREKEGYLFDCLEQIKKYEPNKNVLISSHLPPTKKMLDNVDGYVYDSSNPVFDIEEEGIIYYYLVSKNYKIDFRAFNYCYTVVNSVKNTIHLIQSSKQDIDGIVFINYDMEFEQKNLEVCFKSIEANKNLFYDYKQKLIKNHPYMNSVPFWPFLGVFAIHKNSFDSILKVNMENFSEYSFRKSTEECFGTAFANNNNDIISVSDFDIDPGNKDSKFKHKTLFENVTISHKIKNIKIFGGKFENTKTLCFYILNSDSDEVTFEFKYGDIEISKSFNSLENFIDTGIDYGSIGSWDSPHFKFNYANNKKFLLAINDENIKQELLDTMMRITIHER